MKHAIVSGATGFIGRWLTRELLSRDINVVAIIRPNSANLNYLPRANNLQLIECPMEQVCTLPELLPKQEDRVFYHLAWSGVSGPDRNDPSVQIKNIAAAIDTVKVAVQLECMAYIGLGSIMEFESIAVANADGVHPGMGYIYGGAKQFAHLATKAIAAQSGINHLWPILTNAYGEYEYSNRFINTTLRKILRHEVLEFTEGTQIYDFIYVGDVARALALIGEKGKPFKNYVIGSGQAKPLRSFIETIGRTLAPDQLLHFGNVPYRGAQLLPEIYSISSLARDTGFLPQVSFETGICRTMEWLKKEENK